MSGRVEYVIVHRDWADDRRFDSLAEARDHAYDHPGARVYRTVTDWTEVPS